MMTGWCVQYARYVFNDPQTNMAARLYILSVTLMTGWRTTCTLCIPRPLLIWPPDYLVLVGHAGRQLQLGRLDLLEGALLALPFLPFLLLLPLWAARLLPLPLLFFLLAGEGRAPMTRGRERPGEEGAGRRDHAHQRRRRRRQLHGQRQRPRQVGPAAVLQEVPVQVERVEEGLGEEAKGAEHAGEEAVFGARLPRPVHCHFNSLVVGGALQRFGLDGDGDGERFAAS